MILPILLLALGSGPSILTLDGLAQARNVAELETYVIAPKRASGTPLQVLTTNGAYEGGKFGWRAETLKDLNGAEKYVVLTTPLTVEDIGDFLFERVGDKLKLIPEDDDLGARIVRHSLEVRFDPPNKSVAIADEIALEAEPGSEPVALRMGQEFKVSSVADEGGRRIPFSQAGGVVLIPRPPGGKGGYRLSYTAVLDHAGYSASVSTQEATLTNDYWYPLIARQPASYQVTVHAPRGWTVVGQGLDLQNRDTDSERLAKFKMELPVVYYSLSAGPFKKGSVERGGKTYTAWSSRKSEDTLVTQAETQEAILQFYSARFGPFPFAGYGQLDSLQYGDGTGAMEAYSYATYGGGFPVDDSHEMSHTYWGGILCNSYLHSFWNESFAVYSEGLFRREAPVGNVAERERAYTNDGNADPGFESGICSASGVDTGPTGSTMGYNKGAKVLRMLEELMGQDSLLKAMRRWVKSAPGTRSVEWEDFEKVAEEERPDLKLAGFFRDWLDRPGFAEIQGAATYKQGKVFVSLKFKGKPYRIPLQVLLLFPDGASLERQFDVSSDTTLAITSSKKPSAVSLDPSRVVIRRIDPSEGLPSLRTRMSKLERVEALAPLPADLAGKLLIGSPVDEPSLKPLFDRVGFVVHGSELTYKGTTVDLNKGMAMAIVDLGNGKSCVIQVGKTRIRPDLGRAQLALVDDLGRIVRAWTPLKTTGALTYRL